ncbi:MAG: ABC transporter permease [Bacteroidales bacterium]|nr:ABC transporter permease [Bacteroidales bacterium]
MNKTFLIIKREYITHVRTKAFIILTLLGPILTLLLMGIPAIIEMVGTTTSSNVGVIDRTERYGDKLTNTDFVNFTTLDAQTNEDSLKQNLEANNLDGFLLISDTPTKQGNAKLYSSEALPVDVSNHIERDLREMVRKEIVADYTASHAGASEGLDSLLTNINNVHATVSTINISKEGDENETNSTVSIIVAVVTSMIIYIFLCIYGSMVMTGVIEEKNNRIMEVLVASVKPRQLLIGKIFGIVGVAITQVLCWLILGGIIMNIGGQFLQSAAVGELPADATAAVNDSTVSSVLNALSGLNLIGISAAFLFFSFGGILLYATLFASVGSGVDNPGEGQQLSVFVMLPIIVAIYLATATFRDPNGALAIWSSIIPFTSPIVMMARLPFGVPAWQIILSCILLIATIILFIWIAARIYRVGILMYGKTASLKELWRWFKQSN